MNEFKQSKELPEGVYTAYVGNNAKLVKQVGKLYLKNADKVADITYGKGAFWREMDMNAFHFFPSDKVTCPKTPYDFKSLPYEDNTFSVTVFDPPYMHNAGKPMVEANYQNAATTKGMYHADIVKLYRDGMMEAKRITKPQGFIWVKCQDEIEASKQQWTHIEIYNIATELNLYAKDFFVLVQDKWPCIQHKAQKHGRKNHSYLWILQKVA